MPITLSFSKRSSIFQLQTIAIIILTIWLLMDIHLFYWIRFSLPPSTTLPISTNTSANPCYYSPYCHISVKMIVNSPPDFYYNYALVAYFVNWLHLDSQHLIITPNLISFIHLAVAAVAGRLVNNKSLWFRRFACLVFEVRNWLDVLDGYLARKRHELKVDQNQTEIVESQSTIESGFFSSLLQFINSLSGPLVEGLTDIPGFVFFLMGCVVFLHRYPLRRTDLFSYKPLMVIHSNHPDLPESKSKSKDLDTKWYLIPVQIIKSRRRSAGILAILYGFQIFISALGQQRYFFNYSEMMEVTDSSSPQDRLRKAALLHSTGFWLVSYLWRHFNPRQLLTYLAMAICTNKMGEYLYFVRYLGFLVMVFICAITEIHIYYVRYWF